MKFNPVKFISVLTAGVLCFVMFSLCAFADTASSEKEAALALAEIYDIIKAISVPAAAVGIAASGVQMVIYQDAETAARAKRRIVIICIASAAVLLLPAVFEAGKELVSSGAWSPDNPG